MPSEVSTAFDVRDPRRRMLYKYNATFGVKERLLMAKVLVVDDVAEIARLLARIVSDQGHEALLAYDGRQALEIACAQRPDAIIMDVMMPEMNGLEACQRLKADADLCRIPVILVTAKDSDEDIVCGLDAGADDYVTKPFSGRVLSARLRAALRVKQCSDAITRANDQLRQEIYERKQVEATLRKKEEELRQSQKLEAIGRLAGGIAHEFNNLLQAIMGYTCSAMDNDYAEEERCQDLEHVLKAARRAANLTRQLLGFSRRQQLTRKHVDPNEIVTDLAGLLEPFVGEQMRLELELGTDVKAIYADAEGLQQALLNLCLNARDAMPQGGTLVIRTAMADYNGVPATGPSPIPTVPYVAITVSDTGCGMSPEVQEHIFEPFYTTKEVGKGTGLGLATVYGIVQQHGGAIEVSSEPGKGATFTIYLPAVDAEPDAKAPEADAPVYEGSELILLAEDEPLVRQSAVRRLERAGYTVLAASDGKEAWRLYEEHRGAISLALLDRVMPGLTGHELWDRIRADDPQVRVIFCTGYDPDAARVGLAEDEWLPVLEKPFDSGTLLRTVRQVLDGEGLPAGDSLQDAVLVV